MTDQTIGFPFPQFLKTASVGNQQKWHTLRPERSGT